MSWYTTTYVGIQDKDGKIYPFGPYNARGDLCPIYSHPRSFSSDINEEFIYIEDNRVTEELKKEFPYILGEDGDCRPYFGYLPEDQIPTGSYIKTGYCLISQINEYLEDKSYFDGFYPVISPTEYAMRMESELKFGPPKPKKDEYGEEYTEHSCSEFAYFAWPDYTSIEYEACLMRLAIDILDDYELRDKGYKFVIIKTEG